MRIIHSVFNLIRFPNLIIIVLSQLFFKFVVIDDFEIQPTLTDLLFIKTTIGTFLIAAAGYVINDYYDVKIDVINRPQSVIIERVFSRKQAIIFHSLLNASALLIGFNINFKIFFVFLFCAILLWWYSNFLKKQAFWGNLSIAILAALTVLLLAFIYQINNQVLYFYSGLIFTITLAREIVKDMEDSSGDKTHGCKTLPIVYGIRQTKFIVSLILSVFLFLIIITPFYIVYSVQTLFLIIIFPLTLKIFILLHKSDTIQAFHKLSSLCKWIMIIGVLSILFIK